jgi:hypothetical protein
MKKVFAICIGLALALLGQIAYAQSLGNVKGVAFGGRVTAIQPCNTGILAYLATARGPLSVMWFWGNLPFASYLPPHPGQYVLGRAGTTIAPCVLGTVPYGGGLPILYHGSSL